MGKSKHNILIGDVDVTPDRDYLRMTAEAHLLVALTETRDHALTPEGLRTLVTQYNGHGLALHVWDDKTEAWVRLTKQILKPDVKS